MAERKALISCPHGASQGAQRGPGTKFASCGARDQPSDRNAEISTPGGRERTMSRDLICIATCPAPTTPEGASA
jgi:hypothetical protein